MPPPVDALEAPEEAAPLPRAPEDGLLMALEVFDLQEEPPDAPGALDVIAPGDGDELVPDPLVTKPAGERVRAVIPHRGHEDIDGVVRAERALPEDERHRSSPAPTRRRRGKTRARASAREASAGGREEGEADLAPRGRADGPTASPWAYRRRHGGQMAHNLVVHGGPVDVEVML